MTENNNKKKLISSNLADMICDVCRFIGAEISNWERQICNRRVIKDDIRLVCGRKEDVDT